MKVTEMQSQIPAKPVNASQVEMTEVVLPNDANNFGTLFGGKVMQLIDICGAIAARRHCGRFVVTAFMDSLAFLGPVRVGDIVILKGSVNRAFRTSMEVGIKVFAEDTTTGELRHTASAYLTYVAMNEAGKPTPIPSAIPETPEQKRRCDEALQRRGIRLASCHTEVNR